MNVEAILKQLAGNGCDPVRRRRSYSWGDRETCRGLLAAVFRAVDRTVRRFEFLPEYEAVADWMADTQGRGLLLYGDCGRGKSTIITGVVPVLLFQATGAVVRAVHSEQLTQPCAASWPGMGAAARNIDYLCATRFPIIDEAGIEPEINDYGARYEGFCRVLNAAEQRVSPVFVSTNLTPEQLAVRYDRRTVDRLVRLTKAIEFRGRSYR